MVENGLLYKWMSLLLLNQFWKKKMRKNIAKNRKKKYTNTSAKFVKQKKCMNTAHVFKVIFNFSVKIDTENILHNCSFQK